VIHLLLKLAFPNTRKGTKKVYLHKPAKRHIFMVMINIRKECCQTTETFANRRIL